MIHIVKIASKRFTRKVKGRSMNGLLLVTVRQKMQMKMLMKLVQPRVMKTLWQLKAKQERGNGKSIMTTTHLQFTGTTRLLESRRMLTHLKRRVENTASQMAMVRICKTRVMTLPKPRTIG